jgi:hypothetical protein
MPTSSFEIFHLNVNTVKKNTEALLGSCSEVGLEVNTEKTKNMVMSHHQNVGQYHNLMIANKSFENVAVQMFRNDSRNP